MSAPLRVLHVAETAQGGVGSYIEEVSAVQLARHGAGALQLVLPAEHAAHFRRLPAEALHGFSVDGVGRLRSMLRLARTTLAVLRAWRPDVVHIHSTYAGFALRPLLALQPGRPKVVYCAHGWAFDRQAPAWLNRTVAAIERTWSRWCDAVVCISGHDLARGAEIGIAPKRLKLVLNAIADAPAAPADGMPAETPWPAGALRVLFVGRLDRQKGVDVLCEAMRRLGPRAHALVVGAAVVAADAPAEPPANMHLVGWQGRERIAALMREADVLVVPSRWEGFGLVALEAMRAGLGVVASRVGGLPEVVADGRSGLLVPPDDPARLAEAIASRDAAGWHALGAAGRRRYEALFRIERLADELDTLYAGLLERAPAAPLVPPVQGAT